MRRERNFRERSRSPGGGAGKSAVSRPATGELLSGKALIEAARKAREAREAEERLRHQQKYQQQQHQLNAQLSAQLGDMNAVVCTHYLQGRCNYGDTCAKRHLAPFEASQRALGLMAAPESNAVPPVRRGFFAFAGRRLRGVVKSVPKNSPYGFISCRETYESFGHDVYTFADQIRHLDQGLEVTFELVLNDKGRPQAKNVMPYNPFHGFIKSIDPKNGFAWIACNETWNLYQRDVWVQEQQVGQLQVSQEVSFSVGVNHRGQPHAKCLLPERNGSFQAAQAAAAQAAASASDMAAAAAASSAQPGGRWVVPSEAYDPFAPAPAGPSDVGRKPSEPSEPAPAGPSDVGRKESAPLPSSQPEAYDPFAEQSEAYDPFAEPSPQPAEIKSRGHVDCPAESPRGLRVPM